MGDAGADTDCTICFRKTRQGEEALERVRQEKAQKVAAEKAAREAKAAAMLAKMAEDDAGRRLSYEVRINLKREADRQR